MLTHDEPVELTRFNQVLDQFTDRSDVLLETLERLAEALHRFAFAQELAAIRSDYDAYEFELEEVDATVDTEAVRALDECLAEAQYHLRRVVACGKKIEEGVVTSSFSLEIRARTAEPFTALFPHLTQLRHALRRARDYTADTPFASRAQRLVLARIRELDEKRLEPLAQSLRPALAAFVARSVSDQNHDVAAAALHSLQALASLSERVDMIARRVEAARCADEASLRELAAVTAHIARSLESFSSNPLIWTFLQRERDAVTVALDRLSSLPFSRNEYQTLVAQVSGELELLRRASSLVSREPERPVSTFPETFRAIEMGWRVERGQSVVTYEITGTPPAVKRVQLFARDPLGKVLESTLVALDHEVVVGQWLDFNLHSPIEPIHGTRLQALC